jgi:deoxyribose-phosphate aldolase
LTDDEISRASQIAVSAGAQYIKTGTGWASKPTTVSNVALIKEVIGDSARIKVAGGIRSLDIMLEMIDAGCCRFGISYKSALLIMRELDERLGRNQYQTSTMTEQRKGLI